MLDVDFFARPVFQSAPARRSPLGARDPNTCSWNSPPPPMSSDGKCTLQTIKTRNLEPRKREGKFAAVTRKKDDRDQRRNAFLSRGVGAREDKRYEARAEQNQRLQWLEEKRQWEAQKAIEESPQGDVEPDIDAASTPHDPDHMADSSEDLPSPDDEELYQYYLLSQEHTHDTDLPGLSQTQFSNMSSSQPMEFWSDDDDFDQHLLEAAIQLERGPDWQQSTPMANSEEMDMSMG